MHSSEILPRYKCVIVSVHDSVQGNSIIKFSSDLLGVSAHKLGRILLRNRRGRCGPVRSNLHSRQLGGGSWRHTLLLLQGSSLQQASSCSQTASNANYEYKNPTPRPLRVYCGPLAKRHGETCGLWRAKLGKVWSPKLLTRLILAHGERTVLNIRPAHLPSFQMRWQSQSFLQAHSGTFRQTTSLQRSKQAICLIISEAHCPKWMATYRIVRALHAHQAAR